MNFIKSHYQKILISVFFILLATLSVSRTLDIYGEQYTKEGMQRSVAAFAIAKGLNGVISVVQGTELAIEPAGVGLVLTPGQILDPANDLIERFSWVMLVCTTSLGIQMLLLTIFSSVYFSSGVAIVLLLVMVFAWRDSTASVGVKNAVYRFAALIIVLRFFIPAMAITSDGLYKAFLASKYVESSSQLEVSSQSITSISQDGQQVNDEVKDVPWYDLFSSRIEAAIDAVDIDNRVDQLKQEADRLTNHIIDLIVVFVMQTIILPLVFIWLSMRLIKAMFGFRFF